MLEYLFSIRQRIRQRSLVLGVFIHSVIYSYNYISYYHLKINDTLMLWNIVIL